MIAHDKVSQNQIDAIFIQIIKSLDRIREFADVEILEFTQGFEDYVTYVNFIVNDHDIFHVVSCRKVKRRAIPKYITVLNDIIDRKTAAIMGVGLIVLK